MKSHGEFDSVDCGSGADTLYLDQHDRARNCEAVHPRYGRLFPGQELGAGGP